MAFEMNSASVLSSPTASCMLSGILAKHLMLCRYTAFDKLTNAVSGMLRLTPMTHKHSHFYHLLYMWNSVDIKAAPYHLIKKGRS